MPRVIPLGISLIKRTAGTIGLTACVTANCRQGISVCANIYDRASGSIPLTGDISDSDIVFFGPSTVVRRNVGTKI